MSGGQDSLRPVLLANAGARLSFQTALALDQAQLLNEFVTTFYYKNRTWIFKTLNSLPSKVSNKLEQEFLRRYIQDLEQDRINTNLLLEILFVLSRKYSVLLPEISNWRNNEFRGRIKKRIFKNRPQAVVCCDGWGLPTFSAGREVNSLCILDQNTAHLSKMARIFEEERVLNPEFSNSLAKIPLEVIEERKEEALSADAIIVSSEYAQTSLVEIGVPEQKVHIVRYGTDTSRFKPLEKKLDNKFNVLFVGNIGQGKGIKYLLEAFKVLRLKNAELTLIGSIVGDGAGLKKYRDLFTYVPNVAYQNIHRYFQKADLFVIPTLHESGVLAIHEALACGVPVITTPHAGSVVRDKKDGFIVPIRDTVELSNRIEQIYLDRDLKEEFSQSAAERGRYFSWERYRNDFSGLVKSLLVSYSG